MNGGSDAGVLDALRGIFREAIGLVVPRLGRLRAHLDSVQDLIPEIMRIETFPFEAAIASDGTITQPDKVKVPAGYLFDCFGIDGWIEEPGLAVANFALLRYNVEEDGKRKFFNQEQRMARHLTIVGPNRPIWYPRSLYLTAPGAILTSTFSLRSGSTWNGAAKRVGINLIGGLVVQGGARR